MPQEQWQKKAGLISKAYKLKQSLVDDFAKSCKDRGKSQASVLSELMQDWIEKGE